MISRITAGQDFCGDKFLLLIEHEQHFGWPGESQNMICDWRGAADQGRRPRRFLRWVVVERTEEELTPE